MLPPTQESETAEAETIVEFKDSIAILRSDLERRYTEYKQALDTGFSLFHMELIRGEVRLNKLVSGGEATSNGNVEAIAVADRINLPSFASQSQSLSSQVASSGIGSIRSESLGRKKQQTASPLTVHFDPGQAGRNQLRDINHVLGASTEQMANRASLLGFVTRFVKSNTFDAVSGALVLCSVVLLVVQIEQHGCDMERILELENARGNCFYGSTVLIVLDHSFNACFFLEVALRCFAYGRLMFKSAYNMLDMFIVCGTVLDSYVMDLLVQSAASPKVTMLRMFRFLKLVKLLRAAKTAAAFSDLRVIIKTVLSSMMTLLWSLMVIGGIILFNSILLAQLLGGFIQTEDAKNYELRLWVYERYGSIGKASYTMFEATFSGGWPNYARTLVMEVSPWFAIYWVIYVTLVVFALLRIVSSIFLRATLKVSTEDEDMMVMEKMKDKQKVCNAIYRLFQEIDTSNDGCIDRAELDCVLQDPRLVASLTSLEIEAYELDRLFNMLVDDEGKIPFVDFLGGMLRLKGSAKAVDSIAIMLEQNKIKRLVEDIWDFLGQEKAQTFLTASQQTMFRDNVSHPAHKASLMSM